MSEKILGDPPFKQEPLAPIWYLKDIDFSVSRGRCDLHHRSRPVPVNPPCFAA